MHESLERAGFDGRAVLHKLIEATPLGTLEQAIATYAVFSDPATVRGTERRPLFRIVRDQSRRHQHGIGFDGKPIMYDDNKGPTDAFIWTHAITRRRYRDVQFAHLWQDSGAVDAYTSLANICMVPAFLAKLTDVGPCVPVLQFRAYDLYGFVPAGKTPPSRPAGYDRLRWAPTLPPVTDLEGRLRRAMATKRKDSTTNCARSIGWIFSDYQPDPLL